MCSEFAMQALMNYEWECATIPKPSTILPSELTLSRAGVPCVDMAALLIYLMDVCN